MMPLYDMMRQAGQGRAAAEMARRFGLSETQIADAFAALAPAFSAGLKRNAAGPAPMADFLAALADGHHRRYFEDVQAAFSPQGIAEGNGILGHLFGSRELSRRVAAEAAGATGIGADIFRQMLPVMASMIMGGLFQQANAAPHTQQAFSGPRDIFGDMLKQMIRYQAEGRKDLPEPQPASPFSDPAFGPFGEMMDAMFAGTGQHREPPPEEEAEEELPEAAPPTNAYEKVFGQMFDAGREVQSGYQKSIESIVDQYLDGMKRQR